MGIFRCHCGRWMKWDRISWSVRKSHCPSGHSTSINSIPIHSVIRFWFRYNILVHFKKKPDNPCVMCGEQEAEYSISNPNGELLGEKDTWEWKVCNGCKDYISWGEATTLETIPSSNMPEPSANEQRFPDTYKIVDVLIDTTECPTCEGDGYNANPEQCCGCTHCKGTGRVPKQRLERGMELEKVKDQAGHKDKTTLGMAYRTEAKIIQKPDVAYWRRI